MRPTYEKLFTAEFVAQDSFIQTRLSGILTVKSVRIAQPKFEVSQMIGS